MQSPYTRSFYAHRSGGSAASAEVVVPLLLSVFPVRSVVDIGCGTGAWLEAFAGCGIGDYLGIDGPYVSADMLRIPARHFRAADLARLSDLDRRFDLACSLEVAEHLPRSSAGAFVALLTSAAPVVLFSAAIPHQGGTGHVNEQWQSYWHDLFAAQGFEAIDCIRPAVYGDRRVEWWYRQNILVYCRPDHRPRELIPISDARQLNYVDPEMIERMAAGPDGVMAAAQAIGRDIAALGRALGRRLAPRRARDVRSAEI